MQVLLARRKDREEMRQSSESGCLLIWKRLLDTLIKYIENPADAVDRDGAAEDLNVEHAQLLLFLFHSLQLMQKKSILLLCAQTLIQAAHIAFSIVPLRDVQLVLLARVLLLLEYLIKNLYDAPASMLEQIQWNLLASAGLSSDGSKVHLLTALHFNINIHIHFLFSPNCIELRSYPYFKLTLIRY